MATLTHSDSRRLYSWWWDSHISPKNSKWLQENLTDMDAKVKAMIKLIEEDADSFARRAEMYYKKRPELMKLVEEFYRAYRALAERYDHATGELRHAHRTMAEAFPDQVPFVLAEDSPLGSSIHVTEPHTPEMPHPVHALLDPDDMNKDALGLSSSDLNAVKKNGSFSGASDARIGKKGFKQLHEMFGTDHNSKFAEENLRKGPNQGLEEREQLAGKAESEVQKLKKALADMQSEKEAVLLQYQQCLEKLLYLEGEFSYAKKNCTRLNDQAREAETEVHKLKEAITNLETERDAGLIKHQECMKRISNLECEVSQAQEDVKGHDDRATKLELEAQRLKNELFRLESEKEVFFLQYRESVEKISYLENKISNAEKSALLLSERADRAEAEVKKLEKVLAVLNEEKQAAILRHEQCLERISKLETAIASAHEDVKHLNSEILMEAEKLKSAEKKCAVLEISNQYLKLEADNLAKKIAMKDQQLSKRHEELDELQICVQDERLRCVQIETTLKALQSLHFQSQEEQRALALEFKNEFQMLKNLEICKHDLEEELRRVKDENQNLNELNSSSTMSMENLQTEILGLREMKQRLEEDVAQQIGKSNALQQQICHLKEEIKSSRGRYQALMEHLESVGLNPECIRSTIKNLQDENLKLKLVCENDRDEKAALSEKLENMERLSEKNVVLEVSLSHANGQLEGLQEKIKALQESCQFLSGEKSAFVAEKSTLLSQLQIVTESLQKLLEKNAALENSLSGANVELEVLREKSKSLEEICQLLKNEKSNLLTERSNLVVQLENVERRLEKLEKQFIGLEQKYAGLEEEKESTHSQVEELRISLGVEKQERASSVLWSETRLAGLENHIHLLQEENRWRKKEFEEELDKAVNAQFEIFVLQKFIQDMEEKNYSLLIECQKYFEASKFTEKLISELENENLEQQVEAELLLYEIQKLRLGIYRVSRSLEIGPDGGSEYNIDNDQILMHDIFVHITNMKCSLSKYEDDKQQLFIENSVLLTLLEQLKLGGMEIGLEKKMLDQELKIKEEQLVMVQNDKHEIVEINRQLRSEVSTLNQQANILKAEMEILCLKKGDLQRAYLKLQKEYAQVLEENRSLLKIFAGLKEEKCMVEQENDGIILDFLALDNLLMIFKSFGMEKAAELKLLSENMHNLHGVNHDLEEEVNVLKEKLGMKETENLILKDSVQWLEVELSGIREFNQMLALEISCGKDVLTQREIELSEAEKKHKETENLNSALCKTMQELMTECEESDTARKGLEKQILELSEHNMSQNQEIECLHEVNGKLLSEVDILQKENEELRIREEHLNSELQEKTNEFELWEAEAVTFYFDLQISSFHEVLFKNKVDKLAEVCETLEGESASKTREIERMTDRISFMEGDTEGLKVQLFAYAPVIESLTENVASLEHNILSWTKLDADDNGVSKDLEVETHQHEERCEELIKDHSPLIPNGISELHKLQARIKAVEKLVAEEINKIMPCKSSNTNMQLEASMGEIEEPNFKCRLGHEKDKHEEAWGLGNQLGETVNSEKTDPETSEVKNGTLMKDIPLDQVSDGKFHAIKKVHSWASHGADDQMLELWETSEEDCSFAQTTNDSQKQACVAIEDDIVYQQSEDMEKISEHPSSELRVEKELSVDKLQVSGSNRGGNNRKILERLASDAQKLSSLHITVQDLRRKLGKNKKIKKSKKVDFETVKEQLEEVEETVVQLVDLNGQLIKNIEKSPSCSDRKSAAEIEEALHVRGKRVSEQARRESEKLGRLQLEVQKIQYVLLKLEDEKKSKGGSRFFKSKTTIILRDFIHGSKRGSRRRKKYHACGCFRPTNKGDNDFL